MVGWVFYLFYSLWLFFRALSFISTWPFETQRIQSLKTVHTIYLWCLTTIGLNVGWLGGFYYLFYSLWLLFISLSFIPTWPFETQSIQSPTTIHTIYLWCPTMIGLHMGWLGGFCYLFYSLWLLFRSLSFIQNWPFRTQSIQSLTTIHTVYPWCPTPIGLHMGCLGECYYMFYSLWLFLRAKSFIPTWPFETQSIQSLTTIHTVYFWCPTTIGFQMGWLGECYFLYYSLWLLFRS